MDHADYVAATKNCRDKSKPLVRGNAKAAYLGSSSVRDCRTSANAKLHHRVPARVGITGGFVSDSQGIGMGNHVTHRNLKPVVAEPRRISPRQQRMARAKSMNAGVFAYYGLSY